MMTESNGMTAHMGVQASLDRSRCRPASIFKVVAHRHGPGRVLLPFRIQRVVWHIRMNRAGGTAGQAHSQGVHFCRRRKRPASVSQAFSLPTPYLTVLGPF